MLTVLTMILSSCQQPEKQIAFEDLPPHIQSDPDAWWIVKILNYESEHGSAYGTGLPYWGNLRDKPTTVEEAIESFKRNYLPRVKSYPPGVRERLGDYYYNTGRYPEHLLLYAAKKITLKQLNSKESLNATWKVHKAEILQSMQDKSFIQLLDMAKDSVYMTTQQIDHQPNSKYYKTWKPRTWMWSNEAQP